MYFFICKFHNYYYKMFFDFSLVLSQKVVVQGLAFAEKSLAVAKGENLHFRVERSESDTPLEAKISIQPGTGVHGVAYQDEIQVLQFQTGESKKDLCSVGLCLMQGVSRETEELSSFKCHS